MLFLFREPDSSRGFWCLVEILEKLLFGALSWILKFFTILQANNKSLLIC